VSAIEDEASNIKFLNWLVAEVPELSATLTQHLEWYDEILSTLFMGDIARWADTAANSVSTQAAVSRTLDLLDMAWIEGGRSVHTMIADSFLENLVMSGPLWELLPTDLRRAAEQIHESQPDWENL
jgi:hypothetical protein